MSLSRELLQDRTHARRLSRYESTSSKMSEQMNLSMSIQRSKEEQDPEMEFGKVGI